MTIDSPAKLFFFRGRRLDARCNGRSWWGERRQVTATRPRLRGRRFFVAWSQAVGKLDSGFCGEFAVPDLT
jgi:hypothetical protein